ncbi:MAG: hypothetical protein ABIS84_02685 [Arachnia sp.]
MATTLFFTVGSAILMAGVVLLIALVFPLSTSLLVYSFALGLGIVSLIFVLLKRASQAGMVILVVSTALGLGAATLAWEDIDVTPLVGLAMASLLAAVAALAARLGNSASTLVWLAWLALAVDFFAPEAFTSALAGAFFLVAMIGRGWPRQQVAVALAMAFSGFQGTFGSDPAWPVLWLATTVVLTLWFVHFHRAAPAVPAPDGLRRPPWVLPTRGELGGQPWELSLILLPTAWLVSFTIRGAPGWLPLLVAAVALVAALLLPEPPGAVNPQGPLRDGLALVAVAGVGISLLVGRTDPVVEPLVLLVLAIAAQVVPVIKSSLGWLFRAIPAVLALFAGGDAVVAVWGGASALVSDPVTILQGILLTVLGVTLMVFRHGRVNEVLDGVRFVGGLYLCVHGVVLAASLIGMQVGALEGGFLIGHTIASLGWMAFAAFLALRKGSAADLTLAAVVALGAATKLVLFDMATLSGIARVAAFMGCGAIMVVIAFLRQRRRPATTPRPQGEAHAPAPWGPHTSGRH